MKVYLDTNILMDLLFSTRPHHGDAEFIFEMAKQRLIEAFVSTQSIIDTVFSGRKYTSDAAYVRESLHSITRFVNIVTIGLIETGKALLSTEKDLEDMAQAMTAYGLNCNIIISNDKNFPLYPEEYPILVMSSAEFVNTCKRLDNTVIE